MQEYKHALFKFQYYVANNQKTKINKERNSTLDNIHVRAVIDVTNILTTKSLTILMLEWLSFPSCNHLVTHV